MGRISNKTRQFLAERASGCCEYCKSQLWFSTATFPGDHIISVAEGGSDGLDNLAHTCSGCNGHKHTHSHGIDPVTGQKVRLFHPRKDVWDDHFRWSADFLRIEGITAIGRATVARLKLNREYLINLRFVLMVTGFHPPN